ncbi:MAG: hypothetical protein R6V53_03815 [Candidatus Woesearchaeota archaeon]
MKRRKIRKVVAKPKDLEKEESEASEIEDSKVEDSKMEDSKSEDSRVSDQESTDGEGSEEKTERSEDTLDSEDTKESEEPEKKRKRHTRSFIIVSLLFVGILAVILLAIFLNMEEEESIREYQYNGFNILNMSGRWFTTVNVEGRNRSHTIEMHYGPMEVDSIPLDPQALPTIFRTQKVYLTVDPDASSHSVIGMVEVGKFLGQTYDFYNIPSEAAFTKENDAGRTVITCDNATSQNVVLDFRVTNKTSIDLEDNCIIVQGATNQDVIRASNRLGYALAGII